MFNNINTRMPKFPSTKRKSRVRSARKKKTSNSKKTWENMLKDKRSVSALKKSWTAKNPQEYYRNAIKKLVHEHGRR